MENNKIHLNIQQVCARVSTRRCCSRYTVCANSSRLVMVTHHIYYSRCFCIFFIFIFYVRDIRVTRAAARRHSIHFCLWREARVGTSRYDFDTFKLKKMNNNNRNGFASLWTPRTKWYAWRAGSNAFRFLFIRLRFFFFFSRPGTWSCFRYRRIDAAEAR